MVFFPVARPETEEETSTRHHEGEVETELEYVSHEEHDDCGIYGVAAVVEKLSQWRGLTQSPGLLSVNTV